MTSKGQPEDLDESVAALSHAENKDVSAQDKTVLVIARLMEGGQEDDDTCRTLDELTKLLSEEPDVKSSEIGQSKALYELVDPDGLETILGYMDMRQPSTIQKHATLTLSAYLKASGEKGTGLLTSFFHDRVNKGMYDDFLVVFSVAAAIFPIVPDISAMLFLSDGFVPSLGRLMKRKWKSKKVEQTCLEMINAACMNTACREAIQKYCTEWLEDIIAEQPRRFSELNMSEKSEDSPMQYRVHSENVRNLAAVILTKLQVVPSTSTETSGEKIQISVTTMEELSDMFTKVLTSPHNPNHQGSIEGLAYASLQPKIKEKLASDPIFLKSLLEELKKSPAKSPSSYGGLSILFNLTSYLPTQFEEEKRMAQLKAYANASKPSLQPDTLNSNEYVTKRCKAVFDAGTVPVLVTHSQHGSIASLNLVVCIVLSLARNPQIRGRIAQQGGIKLLVHAYKLFPSTSPSLRLTAHAIALILISTNPDHVFSSTTPLTSAIRPLLTLLEPDPTSETPSLLATFESLLALTNLASTSNSARDPIIATSFLTICSLLLSSTPLVVRAATELICNLVQSPSGVAKFADGSKAASQHLHILLALADSEDFETRRAAGGALASLTEWDAAVNAVLERDSGARILLGMCKEDQEEMRHRGIVCIRNMVCTPGKVGEWGVEKIRKEGGVDVLKECLKRSKSQEVVEITAEALKVLLGGAV